MPGIAGYHTHGKPADSLSLERALDLLSHERWYSRDPVFCDGVIAAGRTHPGVIGEKSSPFVSHDIFCWVEGEVYNTPEAAASLSFSGDSFPAALIESYRRGMLPAFLKQVDGYFAAALYDQEKKRIILISDRYGLKPLYYTCQQGFFAWSSEIKGFFVFEDFNKTLSGDALACYLELGHFTGDKTWFEGVSMVSPSTIITYDITSASISGAERYWRWSDIERSKMSFNEAADILCPIIKKCVSRRISQNERIGLALTGGLDSRAILGSLEDTDSITAYTFGIPESWDIVIAKRAAKAMSITHRIFELNDRNWFDGRIRDIWRTDGMQNMLHMHASHYLPDFKELFDINLNGYWGDIIGGFYFQFLGNRYIQTRIDGTIAHELYGRFYEFDNPGDPFYDIDSIDPYVFNNRGRRFAASGSVSHGAFVEQRKPFVDNELIEFVYMLPDEYRIDGRLYNTALLRGYPDLYKHIPWQGSGYPISPHTGGVPMFLHKLRHIGSRLSLARYSQSYTRYETWMTEKDKKALFLRILDPDTAVYPDYIGIETADRIIEPYRNGEAFDADRVSRVLTMEIWLRRVFDAPLPEEQADVTS